MKMRQPPKAALALPLALGVLVACAGNKSAPNSPEMNSNQPNTTKDAPPTTQELKPISQEEFALLSKTLLFGDDDVKYLRMSRDILEPQVEKILDTWYGFVGSTPHLLAYFSNGAGEPQPQYLDAVRKRFATWIFDTADANYDTEWLAYQHEIGLRHHRVKKNKTDNADSVDIIHFRYIIALTIPITETLRPFLEANGHSRDDVDAMQSAWRKSVLLQVILWSSPYVKSGDY